MSRKALVIVGLAALLAATGGVAFASGGGQQPPVSSSAVSEQTNDTYSDNSDDSPYDEDTQDDSNDVVEQSDTDVEAADDGVSSDMENTEPETEAQDDDTSYPVDKQLIADFSVIRVIDHNTSDPVAPQMVFGKYYNSCFFRLYDDDSFEICTSPSTGTIDTGSYTVEDENLIAEYDNGKTASYKILFDDSGDIETLIDASGKYIVYFG